MSDPRRTQPIPDEKLAEFDESARDDRWSLNAYWYQRMRIRMRDDAAELARVTAERDRLAALVGGYEEALEWYDGATRYDCGSECCDDNGARARAALAAGKGTET